MSKIDPTEEEKETMELFEKIIEDKDLSDSLEKESPGITAQMAGYTMSFWLPNDSIRKALMFTSFLVAVLGGLFFDIRWFFVLILTSMFSPRIVANILIFLGELFNPKKENERKK